MKFYANPYNPSATGFYFESTEELEEKFAELKDEFGSPVEEFEIDAIDGTREEMELFERVEVNQSNIAEFIEFIDTSDEETWPAVYFLLERYTLEGSISRAEECNVVQSSLLDAASNLFDECYGYSIPEELRIYIDYEKFAADIKYGGDMVEFEFGGKTYTCTTPDL